MEPATRQHTALDLAGGPATSWAVLTVARKDTGRALVQCAFHRDSSRLAYHVHLPDAELPVSDRLRFAQALQDAAAQLVYELNGDGGDVPF